MEFYPSEYSALYPRQQGRKSSKLLCSEKVLCVGDRLKFANIPPTSKYQMISCLSHNNRYPST